MSQMITVRMSDRMVAAVDVFAKLSNVSRGQVIKWSIEALVPESVEDGAEEKQPAPRKAEYQKRGAVEIENQPLAKGAYAGPDTGRIERDEYSQDY